MTFPLAIPPYPIEGTGNEFLSWHLFLSVVLILPTILTASLISLNFHWAVAIIIGLVQIPLCFVILHTIYAIISAPIREQKQLPKNSTVKTYLTPFPSKMDNQELLAFEKKKLQIEVFYEGYFDGKWDLKNVDMLELLERRHEWASFTWTLNQIQFFLFQWIPETLTHSKQQDNDQVTDHYDRGNDFYNAFLGPTMIYTSGIMTSATEAQPLEQMQETKLATIAHKLNLQKDDRHLDIGMGWGGLSLYSAKKGAHVTGVTLSARQIEWALVKAEEAGVMDQLTYLCMDYRDIPKQKYNKISCVEMSEHVGVLRFQSFLLQVKEMLEDDGLFFLQIAGLRRTWQYEDFMWGLFMAKYVFPGADASMPVNWVIEQLERAGFEVASTETLGVHYSATIYQWYQNWMKNKDTTVNKYGIRWFRIWEFFLAYSTIIARQGSATVYQIVAHKNLNSFDRMQFVERRLNYSF